MPTLESLLTVTQVAHLLGVSTQTVRAMISQKRTPETVLVGRSVRLRASEVHAWISKGCPDRKTSDAAMGEEGIDG